MDKVVVIGDSHSQLFSNDRILNRGTWSNNMFNIFDVRWLGPVTYWRLCRDQKSFIDFNNHIYYSSYNGQLTTKINTKQNVIISLGEIDVRCHIGKKYNEHEIIINNMIENIDKFLIEYIDIFNIHLMSIVPPIRKEDCISVNPDFPFIGTNDERCEMTNYFNQKLKEITNKYNLGYLDIHTLYKDNENMMNINKSDKIVHCIKTSELETYVKNYFNI